MNQTQETPLFRPATQAEAQAALETLDEGSLAHKIVEILADTRERAGNEVVTALREQWNGTPSNLLTRGNRALERAGGPVQITKDGDTWRLISAQTPEPAPGPTHKTALAPAPNPTPEADENEKAIPAAELVAPLIENLKLTPSAFAKVADFESARRQIILPLAREALEKQSKFELKVSTVDALIEALENASDNSPKCRRAIDAYIERLNHAIEQSEGRVLPQDQKRIQLPEEVASEIRFLTLNQFRAKQAALTLTYQDIKDMFLQVIAVSAYPEDESTEAKERRTRVRRCRNILNNILKQRNKTDHAIAREYLGYVFQPPKIICNQVYRLKS